MCVESGCEKNESKRRRGGSVAYRDSEREYRGGITHGMYDLVRGNVIHFYHLIEASGKEASDAGVKGEGRDGLLVIGQSTNAATAGI